MDSCLNNGSTKRNGRLKLRGGVKKVELINPHSWFHIDVKDDDRKVTTWMASMWFMPQMVRDCFLADRFRRQQRSPGTAGRGFTLRLDRQAFRRRGRASR